MTIRKVRSAARFAAAIAVVGLWAGAARGTIVVDTGFEGGSFASTGLTDFSSITGPTLQAGQGAGSSTALDFDSDGAAAGPSTTIGETTFSMMGKFNGAAHTSSGAMSFGWTRASGEFNPFNGGGTGVVASDHVIVSLVRGASNTVRLGAVNGAHGSAATLFGSAAVNLTANNWYRLEGTVLYNPTTKQFTFNDVSVDDFGPTGAAEVTANVLSGTGATVTASSFGTTGRVLYMTNRDRGFELTDNYFADVVPEPGSVALTGAVGGLLLSRRRRRRRRACVAR